MNTKSCRGPKQSNVADQATPPSCKCKANLGTGSRQHHRSPKEAQAEVHFVHTYVNLGVFSLRPSGLRQTRCISYGPRIGQGQPIRPRCFICGSTCEHGLWWNPRTRRGRARPHTACSLGCQCPPLVITPRTGPTQKEEWPGMWHLRYIHSKGIHTEPSKVIKYYFL